MHYKFKTKPFEHQLKALEMSWDKSVFAYFMEMGTGKSKVLIDNISMLYDKGKINGALIVAPKGVYKNWFDSEIPNHMPDHIERDVVLWESNGGKKKEKELEKLFKTTEDLHVLVMNVEAFSTKKGKLFRINNCFHSISFILSIIYTHFITFLFLSNIVLYFILSRTCCFFLIQINFNRIIPSFLFVPF